MVSDLFQAYGEQRSHLESKEIAGESQSLASILTLDSSTIHV